MCLSISGVKIECLALNFYSFDSNKQTTRAQSLKVLYVFW